MPDEQSLANVKKPLKAILIVATLLLLVFILGNVVTRSLRPLVGKICSDFNGDGGSAFAWEDLDADGQQDAGEPPLAGVCIANTPLSTVCDPNQPANSVTDKSGSWRSPLGGGIVGGSCETGEKLKAAYATQATAHCRSLTFYASPPEGYQATTPTTVNGEGDTMLCSPAKFGFVKQPAP